MKNMSNVIIILMLSILPKNSFSQSGWWSQPSGTPYGLYGVCFTDIYNGTTVGVGGTILHTTNGGETWTSQTIVGWPKLMGVCFTDAKTGVVVGDFGTILRTTNRGTNWSNIAPSWIGGVPINGVSFINANVGTVVGGSQIDQWYGIILRTTDGGLSWTDQSINSLGEQLNSVCFTDENHGTAVGMDGIIIRTSNGGKNWIQQLTGKFNLFSVFFIDSLRGTIVGTDGSILRTINGGISWTDYPIPTYLLYSVHFFDSNNGAAVGIYESIYRTTDGGVSWKNQYQTTESADDLHSVFLIDSVNGIAVGEGIGDNGSIFLRTTNGGFVSVKNQNVTNSSKYRLIQNYPNPFNPITYISFYLPSNSFVSLKIFDVLGNEVAVLVEDILSQGSHTLQWNASNFASGVYFYQLHAGPFTETKKLVLSK